LAAFDPGLEGLIVPSKFYGIAAAGRPIIMIGAHDGEIAQLIQQQTRRGKLMKWAHARGKCLMLSSQSVELSTIGADCSQTLPRQNKQI
jgi:hypothetical protein